MPRPKKRKPARPQLTARTADKNVLYEHAVQAVEPEIDFVDRTYAKLNGRKASRLREDFCGTANTSCEWVRRRKTNTAVGVDLDLNVLAWGLNHHVAALPQEAQRRIALTRADVRKPVEAVRGMDCILAMNFSYWIFRERRSLRAYFESVRESLAKGGVFFMDAFGGWEAQKVFPERRRCSGFTYIWEHESFNPISGEIVCNIHFEFPDKTRLNKAFTYHWRLWTLPEIRELLLEAGFKAVTVYWEGDDKKGGGNGIFRPSAKGEVCPSWIVYIAAER
ncbi:MAG: class I SAM-dependent methyltransferase [Planctomycetota bacterium]